MFFFLYKFKMLKVAYKLQHTDIIFLICICIYLFQLAKINFLAGQFQI